MIAIRIADVTIVSIYIRIHVDFPILFTRQRSNLSGLAEEDASRLAILTSEVICGVQTQPPEGGAYTSG